MIKFFRIFAHITTFPALLAFFYLIIKGLEHGPENKGVTVSVIEGLLILTIPVFFNRLAWLMDRSRKRQAP